MELTLRWDASYLNKLIGMTFKENINITTAVLRNIQKLIEGCNFSAYQNKSTIIKRVEFLRRALRARLDEGLEDEGIIINYCLDDVEDVVTEEIIKNLPKYRQLNFKEIKYIIQDVEDKLQFGIVQTHAEKMKDILNRLEYGDYTTYRQMCGSIESWIDDYNSVVRKIRTQINEETIDFDDENITDRVRDVLKRLGSTSSVIITGIQMLNEMLSPGFRPGKLYMFLGLTGGFKSAMLLKIVSDCVKFNAKSYKVRQPGMRPVVLYITLENTKDESFARMYNMTVRADDIETHKAEDVVKDMRDAGLIGNENMGCIITYKANMSITTQDIRNMIDDLQSQGKEVVLLSVDYVKRIMPAQRARDEKEMLKNVTNELRSIAIDYFIPVVSAQQLNRSGLATVNAAMRDNKSDLARFLGGENVGTAYEVMENADMTIILNLERRRTDGKLFLTCYRIKERYRPHTKLDYFNQPFTEGNDIMLYDDIFDDKPAGVISLSTDMDGVNAEMLYDAPKKHNKFNFANQDTQLHQRVKTDENFDCNALSA